jgi:hypothetical protein
MRHGRYAHSIAVVANFVYVIAGKNPSTRKLVTSVVRYDIIGERWVTMIYDFDDYATGTSSITCNARYILTFGGTDEYKMSASNTLVRRLDHLKPTHGWAEICLENSKPCRGFYGLMQLDSKILVFGGINDDFSGIDDDSMTL